MSNTHDYVTWKVLPLMTGLQAKPFFWNYIQFLHYTKMIPSPIRMAAAARARVPLIKFLGPRRLLPKEHHEPTRHPAAPKDSAFPLKTIAPTSSPSQSRPASTSATSGPNGVSRQTMDFAELPARYRHPPLTEAEIEAIETGGATMVY
ncbi:unnamed protein product [Mortierella alpina]